MNRNAQSHFALAPATMDIQRSKFDRSHGFTYTANFGELIPTFCEEVLPGDTFSVSTSKVIRLQTLLKPVFGNMWFDTYFFFVPNRLIWDHFKNFMGESNKAWTPSIEYTVPQTIIPDGGYEFGSLADYLGVPPKVGGGQTISALPFRAYAKIVNDWFINQNLEDPINVDTGDADFDANGSDELISGNRVYIAGKYHDIFSSALPGPLKGPEIIVPFQQAGGVYPVLQMENSFTDEVLNPYAAMVQTVNSDGSSGTPNQITIGSNDNTVKRNISATSADPLSTGYSLQFTNLGVDIENLSGGLSITDLRTSFQIQKFYESLARGGSRYTEIIKSMFNVSSPDARLQRSEYLGGNRIPISVSQVTNNAQTDNKPLGNVGAMSMTNDRHHDFVFSADEHGYVIGVSVARYEHSYPQGLPKHFSRRNRFDYYFPVFANISEQPIYRKELYFSDSQVENDSVFGYQEPWAHYRYGLNRCSSEMRPDHPTSLASWNLADDYESAPYLSHEWAMEDKTNVDRVLAVSSELSNQILVDLWFQNTAVRPMPMYSVPGLIDHH